MKPIRKAGVARDLTICLAAGCLMLTAPVAYWGYRAAIIRAENTLAHEASMLCAKFASVLQKHVWDLDDDAIDAYFKAYRLPDHLVYVNIVTQYGDPVYTHRVSCESGVSVHRRVLINGDEEIGAIEVGMSRAGIEEYRRQVAVLVFAIGATLVLAIGILSAILIRLLLGRPLDQLIRQLQTVSDGRCAIRLPSHRYREIDAIHAEVNLMAERIAASTLALQEGIEERKRAERALQSMADNLEDLVDRRTVQLREVNEELLRESARRRRAQLEILEICNSEQRRIGQDLHDSVCQEMAGIAYLAGSLERNLASKGFPDAALARQIASLLRESVSHTRRVAKGLSPVGLEEDGLVQALETIAADTLKFFHVECRVTCAGSGVVHDNGVAIHLFHIAREAIHNAIRHGKATGIDILFTTEDGTGSLVIRDNGIGFSPSQPSAGGMGMHTMMYRAELIEGELRVQSTLTGGTTITVTFRNHAARDNSETADEEQRP